MGLYLKIGDATSATCSVRVTSRNVKPVQFNNFIVAYQQEMTFQGFLYVNVPDNASPGYASAQLSLAMSSLEKAASQQNVSVGLEDTDTGKTRHWFDIKGAIGGVNLTGFKFLDSPMHMVNEVKYELTVSAMYNNADLKRDLVVLEETLSYTGEGGPDIVLAPQAGAKSVYQSISDFTNVTVTQSGRVLSRTRPSLPPPLWTGDSRIQKVSRDTMSYIMQGLNVFMYQREYQYSFQFPELPTPAWPQILAPIQGVDF